MGQIFVACGLDHHKKHAAAIDDHGKLIQAMRKLYDSSFFDRILTGLGKPYTSASVGNHVHDLIKLGQHPFAKVMQNIL